MRYQAKEYAMKGKIKAIAYACMILKKYWESQGTSNEIYKTANMPGVAVGLAWTYVGGDILFIETSLSDGKAN